MNATIDRQLSHLELGKLQHFQNLAIVPLLVPGDEGPVYLTLAQAMAQGVLTITEVTEGGSVPDLKGGAP